MTKADAGSAANGATKPTTFGIEAKVDLTTSGMGSHSVIPTTSSFIEKVGERGVRDSSVSLVGLLWAMLKHPFGIHDFVEEIEVLAEDDANAYWLRTRVCWLCLSKESA